MNKRRAGYNIFNDFGGGTTDIAIEEIFPSSDVSSLGEPRIMAATGISDLGGKNFDTATLPEDASSIEDEPIMDKHLADFVLNRVSLSRE